MSHCHHEHDAHAGHSRQRMMGAVLLTAAFVVAETIVGYFSHSLALLSDAGHNLTDTLALLFSWYALHISEKPSDPRRTYGYHRVGILAALANSLTLVLIALVIIWEAIQRLAAPRQIQSGPMIVMALVAILINAVIAFRLRHGAKDDVNVRSAYIHMLGDAASSFGVVVAGVVIASTGLLAADAIASFVIAAMILWSSWGILKDTVNTLLEGSPVELDMAALEQTIRAVQGVLKMHDLHVWTVGPGVIACSCHIVVAQQSIQSGQHILRAVVEELEHEYEINHTTIQIEVDSCEADKTYCQLHPTHTDAGHHHHH